MRLLALAICCLLPAALTAEEPPPNEQQQTAILTNVSTFVTQYLNTLPNLVCTQTVQQYMSNKKGEKWREGDTLSFHLTLVQGREHRTLEAVNATPVKQTHKGWKTPLSSEGEFGDLLARVLAVSSDAKITWDRWDKLRDKAVAVFDFAIDQRHSTLRISRLGTAQAVVPYSGAIYVDPVAGTVWRVSEAASDIPKELEVQETATTLDYGPVTISGKGYILPVHATVMQRRADGTVRNEITFADYRKFEAESTIKFDTDSEPAPQNGSPVNSQPGPK